MLVSNDRNDWFGQRSSPDAVDGYLANFGTATIQSVVPVATDEHRIQTGNQSCSGLVYVFSWCNCGYQWQKASWSSSVPSSHATLIWMKMDEAMDEAIEKKAWLSSIMVLFSNLKIVTFRSKLWNYQRVNLALKMGTEWWKIETSAFMIRHESGCDTENRFSWSALNGGLVKWGSNYLEFWGNHQIWPPQDLSTPALRGLEIWNDAVQQESDMNHLYKCHFQDKIRSSHVLNTSTPISWGSRFNFNEMFPGSFQRILGSSSQFNQHFLKSRENSSSGTQGPPIRI